MSFFLPSGGLLPGLPRIEAAGGRGAAGADPQAGGREVIKNGGGGDDGGGGVGVVFVVVVVLTLTHGYNAVRGDGTGSNNSEVEENLRKRIQLRQENRAKGQRAYV